ncbi:MAG: molybdenum cofactor biosynthesis protein MoaE [Oligoflexia bacterium]|nr:molybdenum cofactor biosynthesis protein MoaE [Oligoflexia bacterium]
MANRAEMTDKARGPETAGGAGMAGNAEGIEVAVVESAIDPTRTLARVTDPGHGAETLFLGVVREHNLGRKVLGVSYDAFAPLAETVLREICKEARARWGESLKFAVTHRTGRLDVGEISVAIAVGSRHRDEAYQASRYVIEELKIRAPIWKKEHYEDGESEWLKGHALCSHGERAHAREKNA